MVLSEEGWIGATASPAEASLHHKNDSVSTQVVLVCDKTVTETAWLQRQQVATLQMMTTLLYKTTNN